MNNSNNSSNSYNNPDNNNFNSNKDHSDNSHNSHKKRFVNGNYFSDAFFPFLEQETFQWTENALMRKKYTEVRVWMIVLGILSIIFGIFLLFWNDFSLFVVGVSLAIIFIIIGIFRLIGAFALRGVPTGWRILSFIVGLLFLFEGGIFFKNMNSSLAFLFKFSSIFIGITWIFEGFLQLFESGSAMSTGWSIFSGLVSVIAGFFFLFFPITSMWIFILFIGIWLISIGILSIIRGISLFGNNKGTADEIKEFDNTIREERDIPPYSNGYYTPNNYNNNYTNNDNYDQNDHRDDHGQSDS